LPGSAFFLDGIATLGLNGYLAMLFGFGYLAAWCTTAPVL
jgi:hypothetical protein